MRVSSSPSWAFSYNCTGPSLWTGQQWKEAHQHWHNALEQSRVEKTAAHAARRGSVQSFSIQPAHYSGYGRDPIITGRNSIV